MEAEPGIEPRYTALQSVDVWFFLKNISILLSLSVDPLLRPTLWKQSRFLLPHCSNLSKIVHVQEIWIDYPLAMHR